MPTFYGGGLLEELTGSGTFTDGSFHASLTLEELIGSGTFEWWQSAMEFEPLEISATLLPGGLFSGGGDLAPLTSSGAALAGRTWTGSVTLQPLQLTSEPAPHAALRLEPLTASGTLLPGNLFSGGGNLRRLASAGVFYPDGEFSASLTLQPLVLAATVTSEGRFNASVTLGRLALAASFYSGRLFTGSLTLPVLQGDGEFHGQFVGVGSLTLPMLYVTGSFTSPAPTLAGRYAGLTIDLNSKALTRYDGQPFNSMALFNGVYLAASPTGIYALTGTDDAAAAINAVVRSGLIDFGTNQLKRIRVAYINYRTDGDLTLKVTTDEGDSHEYTIERVDGASLHQNRVKIGRGLVGRHFQWEITNRDGCDFTVNDLTLMPETLRRKVG
jgi:hypothetical protein